MSIRESIFSHLMTDADRDAGEELLTPPPLRRQYACDRPTPPNCVRAYALAPDASRLLSRNIWFMHYLFKVPGADANRHSAPVQALVRACLEQTAARPWLGHSPDASYTAHTEVSVWINFGKKMPPMPRMRIAFRVLIAPTATGFDVLRVEHLDRVCSAVEENDSKSCRLRARLYLVECAAEWVPSIPRWSAVIW